MSTPASDHAPSTPVNDRRMSFIAGLLLALGALLLWFASRMTWMIVEAFDDKAGASTIDLSGATWSTEATAIALLLLVAAVAAFALRRVGRRIVGLISALAAVGASWTPLMLLTEGADPQRAHQLLTSGAASQQASNPVSISSWAEITDIVVSSTGPAVALLGSAIALVGGVLLAMRPGRDGPRLNKYERKAQREEKLAEDLRATPDSGRVLWDALDADIDPTDLHQDRK